MSKFSKLDFFRDILTIIFNNFMTNNYKFARFTTLLLVFFAFLTQTAKAQLEPFAQASGTIAGSNGWLTHSGTAGQILPLTTASDAGNSLSYTGLVAPSGNRTAIVGGNSEDINQPVTSGITNIAYYSTLIKLQNTTGLAANTNVAGDYFMAFSGTVGGPTPGVTTFGARLFIRQGVTANTFNLGILNNSGSTVTPSFSSVDYPINTTLLVVVKYDRATATGGTASLWVNPTASTFGNAIEPTPLATNATGTGTAISIIAGIVIRQAGAAVPIPPAGNTGNTEIDELRTGATWASVTPSAIAITQGTTAIPTANTPAFNMGSIVAGTNLDVTFTVTNAGTAPLTLTTPITIAGTGFSVLTQPISPVANGAGNTTTFVVRFNSATAVTNAVGTVTITNNANTTYTVNLLATATPPPTPSIAITQGATTIPTANTPAFDMGSVATSTNLTTTFTITNAGTAPLTITTPLTVTGAGFTVTTSPATTVPFAAPNNTTTFVVTFNSATAVANAVGTVTITNNANTTYTVNLTASSTAAPTPSITITQGVTAIPTVNSPAFSMGSVAISTDLDVTFTVTNAGTAPLTLTTPITISGTGFSVLTQPISPVVNGAGNTTTFVVRFNSVTAVANAVGTVTITNNANTTYTVNLTASATAPSIAITQGATAIPTANTPAFSMGSVVAGSNLDVTFTVTNAGTAPLTLTTPVTIAGAGFSILTQPTSPVNNGASNTTTFVVRFNSATTVANAVGTVTITNNANTTYTVNLLATATVAPAPSLTVSPISLAFGTVIVGTNVTPRSYVLTGTNLTNNVIITAPSEFQISATAGGTYGTTLPYTVAQMATPQTIFVIALPTTAGAKTGNITHASTGVTTLPTVALTATSIIPTLIVAPASLALGDVTVNTNSVAKSYVLSAVTITNNVTITAPAEFALSTVATGIYSSTLTFTVAEMAMPKVIFVRASPTTLGAKAGNITHTSIDVTTPPIVALTATSVLDNITAGPNLDFGTVSTGAFSDVKSLSVQSATLTADLVVTAPTNFQVSKDGGATFAPTVTFTAAEVIPVSGKTVFVRFAPTSGVSGLKSAVITVTSVGSLTKNVNVTGTETSPTTALDNSFAKEVVIYPNPAQNSFQIKLPTTSKNYAVEIVDISGKVVLTKKSDEIISVENLQKGFYFVKFSNAERTFTKKISIN